MLTEVFPICHSVISSGHTYVNKRSSRNLKSTTGNEQSKMSGNETMFSKRVEKEMVKKKASILLLKALNTVQRIND